MDLQNFTGLREQSAKRMILDAGAAVVGLNEDALTSTGIAAALSTPWTHEGQTVTPRALGATRAGATFDPQKEERQIEVNGFRVPVKGFDRVDFYNPILTLTLLELADFETLRIAMGQASYETTTSGFHKISPRIAIENSDYLPNIALLARTSEDGQVKPAIVVIRNAKVVENATMPFEDPGEVAVEVSFRGASGVLEAATVPCAIYLPVNEDGLGSGSGS